MLDGMYWTALKEVGLLLVDFLAFCISQDMDLIEILWKQDEDLGVSRDAFDYHMASESSSKEAVKPPHFDVSNLPHENMHLN